MFLRPLKLSDFQQWIRGQWGRRVQCTVQWLFKFIFLSVGGGAEGSCQALTSLVPWKKLVPIPIPKKKERKKGKNANEKHTRGWVEGEEGAGWRSRGVYVCDGWRRGRNRDVSPAASSPRRDLRCLGDGPQTRAALGIPQEHWPERRGERDKDRCKETVDHLRASSCVSIYTSSS